MKTYASPRRDAVRDYDKATRRRKAAPLLSSLRSSVHSAYNVYASAIRTNMPPTPCGFVGAAAQHLRTNYGAVAERRSLGDLRKELFRLSDYCPFCFTTSVRSLDHYLPCSAYPEYSILADNLVPMCHGCNELKGDRVGVGDDRFLHVYLDALPIRTEYLVADFALSPPVRPVTFDLRSAGLNRGLIRTLEFTLDGLKLRSTYVEQGERRLVFLARYVNRCYAEGATVAQVAALIAALADASDAEWRTMNNPISAITRAALRSPAFITTDFRML